MVRALGKDGAKLGKVGKQLDKLVKAAAPVGPALPGPIRERQRRRAGCVSLAQPDYWYICLIEFAFGS